MQIDSKPSRPDRRAPKKRNRGDRLTTAWMGLALVLFFVTLATRTAIPQAWWLSIHILTLGVLTNAILQWSWYFSRSLLRLRADDPHATTYQYLRQILFNVALVVLIVGMLTANLWAVVVSALAVSAIVAWHGLSLVIAGRAKLGSRFAVVIRYYVVSAVFLVIGAVEGALIAATMFDPSLPVWLADLRPGLTVSHFFANSLGWVGLTIIGTLITLWPTMLRTRIAEGAVEQSTRALPFLAGSLLVLLIATTVDQMLVAAFGVAVYLAALIWGIVDPLVREAINKHPAGYATWSAGAGMAWMIFGLAATAATLVVTGGALGFQGSAPGLIRIFGIGGALQVLVGALTYLMPVIIGGGPAVVRVGISVLEQAGLLRLVLRNAGLVLALTAGGAAPIFWLLVVASFLLDFFLFAQDGIVQGRAKRERELQNAQEVPRERNR